MFQKKLLIVLLALLLVCMSFVLAPAGKARASAHTSATCGASNCDAKGDWNGTQHGAQTSMTVDDPSVSGGEGYLKYLSLLSDDNQGDQVIVGITEGVTAYSSYCGTTALEYFYLVYAAQFTKVCFPVSIPDINHLVTIGASWFTSGYGGVIIYITNTYSGSNPCTACFVTTYNTETWDKIDLEIDPTNITFSGEWVWGGEWDRNEYYSGSSWDYQQRAFDGNGGNPTSPNPSQMGWYIVPASGNEGGNLYSCVYSSGDWQTCKLGS